MSHDAQALWMVISLALNCVGLGFTLGFMVAYFIFRRSAGDEESQR